LRDPNEGDRAPVRLESGGLAERPHRPRGSAIFTRPGSKPSPNRSSWSPSTTPGWSTGRSDACKRHRPGAL